MNTVFENYDSLKAVYAASSANQAENSRIRLPSVFASSFFDARQKPNQFKSKIEPPSTPHKGRHARILRRLPSPLSSLPSSLSLFLSLTLILTSPLPSHRRRLNPCFKVYFLLIFFLQNSLFWTPLECAMGKLLLLGRF